MFGRVRFVILMIAFLLCREMSVLNVVVRLLAWAVLLFIAAEFGAEDVVS